MREIPSLRRPVLIAAAVLALIGILAPAPTARAGTYVAVQCHPDYDTAAGDALFSRTSDHYGGAGACAGSGAGMQLYHAAPSTKDGRYAAWSWYAPPGTQFASITSEVHVTNHSGHKGFVTIADSGGNVHWRWPAEGSWQPVEWTAGTAATAYTSWLQCTASGGNCGASSAAHTWARRLWFTLRDASPPSIALSGSLYEQGPRRGTHVARIAASDVGGGVWRWRLLVNGDAAGSAEASCYVVPGGPATRFAPCAGSDAREFALDTERPPFREGRNSVTACVSDVGWPANEVCATRAVDVDNDCHSSGPGPASGLEASFANGRNAATSASHRPGAVRGRLGARSGGGLAGADVCVFARVEGGEERLEATLRTDGEGRFDHPLRRGPSRTLRLVHRHGTELVERELTLKVRARPRLKVGPRSRLQNGQTARFRGKLPGPGASGRVVVLQARVGRRWQAFKSARTGAEGRFAARYRFRETTGRRLYRFRAIVRAQDGYPYLPGASAVRRVVVRG